MYTNYGRYLLGISIVGLAVGVGLKGCQFLNKASTSKGSRVGMITKLSEKGLGLKTLEGQMVMGGMTGKGQTLTANTWDFSVDRRAMRGENTKDIRAKLEEAMNYGLPVKVDYYCPIINTGWRGDTNYFVTNVEHVLEERPVGVRPR